jgi:hypothetical protein
MFQKLPRQQHPRQNWQTAPPRRVGKALGQTAFDGRDQGHPRQQIGPLAEGMRFRDAVRDLEARSMSRQLKLQVSQDLHRRLSSLRRDGGLGIPLYDPPHNAILDENKLVVT